MTMKLEWIQVLRAVAAVMVLIAHLTQHELRFLDAAISPLWTSAGVSGVDLFFVISGFVMVYVTRHAPRGSSYAGRFLYARITRIYPPYWLATLGVLAGYVVFGSALNREAGDLNLITSALLWPDQDLPILMVGWTMIHEIYFYLVFAVLLVAPRRFLPLLLAAWLSLIVIAGLIVPQSDSPVFNLITHPLTAEFVLGGGAGLLAVSGRRTLALPMIAAGCVWWIAVTANIAWTGHESTPEGWRRVLAYGVPATFIVYGAACLDWTLKAPRALVAVGDWSYALYLVHLPIIAALVRLWAGAFTDGGSASSVGFIVTGAALSLAGAALMHHVFEKPVLALTRKAGDRMFPAARPVADTPGEATKIW
ncbi:acyltransferase family protein [Maricaulaceae bacterium MS644]